MEIIAKVEEDRGVKLDIPVGAMIELPRAAITADSLTEEADFFSFGTNDLTQTAWGFSRDDVEATFFNEYFDLGVFGVSPFESIDTRGVGKLVSIGMKNARSVKPEIQCGVCGEHGGDPQSIHFFHSVGLDYVSCSPFRVPVARLEAGRAAGFERGSRRGLKHLSAPRSGNLATSPERIPFTCSWPCTLSRVGPRFFSIKRVLRIALDL